MQESDPSDMTKAPTGRPADPRLTIGVFARRSLLSPKALRLYDRLGLLAPTEVDPDTGYRFYREQQLADARLISRLRRLGLPLAAIRQVIAARPEDRLRALDEQWQQVERRHAVHREIVTYLRMQLSNDDRSLRMYDIHIRDVPEQRVITEQRHTTVSGLVDFIGPASGRQWTIAEQHGGPTGQNFVVYHGEVNEDSDGPVEVCTPIPPDVGNLPDVATRIEPAHREAYTRIRKSQVAFPQILAAYDTVSKWITANGHTISAAPREVYLGDMRTAGINDEVCDIAFPIEI